MTRKMGLCGAVFALLAVVLGAFGAHALPEDLEPRLREIWSMATRYQMYHALALFITQLLHEKASLRWTMLAFWSFIAGILLFSGSLYVLVLSELKFMGAIAPLGGLAFILGWSGLLLAQLKR